MVKYYYEIPIIPRRYRQSHYSRHPARQHHRKNKKSETGSQIVSEAESSGKRRKAVSQNSLTFLS